MADVSYNYIKSSNGFPRVEDPKQWYSLQITNDNVNFDSTLTLQAGDYFIINYSGDQNYKYIFTSGPLASPGNDYEINVLLGTTDAECFINLRDAIINSEFLITNLGGGAGGVVGTNYAYAGSSGGGILPTYHHEAVGARIRGVGIDSLEINVSPIYWLVLDSGAETINVRGNVGGTFSGFIGSTVINNGTGEVGEDLSLDSSPAGSRVNAFHENTVEWKLDATAGAGGFFEVIRVVALPLGDSEPVRIATFPANYDPGSGWDDINDRLANFNRIPFTYDSSTETYTFIDTFVIDEKPNCTTGGTLIYPLFSDYGDNGYTTGPATSVPVMGLEFYNGLNSNISELGDGGRVFYNNGDVFPEEGSVKYQVRFIDAIGTVFGAQDAVPDGEPVPFVEPTGNFANFGLLRAERPSVGLVEQSCDAGGEGCDFYRTRVFLPGGLFNDTTFGGFYSTASNEQFLLELLGSQIYNNDITSICSYPTQWFDSNFTVIREVNGVEEEITPIFGTLNCRFLTGGCAFDDVFYTSRDGNTCENEEGIPTIPLDCETVDSLNYYIDVTYTAIPAGAPGTPSCPGDAVTVTGRVRVEPFGEISVITGFFDSSCFGENPFRKTYIPCCPRVTSLNATVGDCFSEQQGDVQLSWTLEYGDVETPVSIEIDRPATASFGSLNVELTSGYADFETGWIDSGVLLPVTCTASETVTYNLTFTYQDATGNTRTEVQSVDVEIPCCFDECVGDGDGDGDCDLCWKVDGTDLQLYLESYFEDPFARQASFQIKYCIDDRCSLGISDATVYITLPIGVSVDSFESDAFSSSFEEDFVNGIYPGRWKFIIEDDPGDITTLLQPTYGVLGTVYLDKPIGDNLVCFDEENTTVTVVPAATPITAPPTADTPIVYAPETNLSYEGATSSAGDPDTWQTGPCLSTCTDEVDIGFGDFHFDTSVVDNNIFDVKYCLTQGTIDSFVLVCVTSDFTTVVSAIDDQFGDAVDRDWDINFRNLAPGFTVIYGNGSRPIPSAGISTLLRVYLSDNILQRNKDGDETCVCIFPLLMNLGPLYSQLEDYIVNFATRDSINFRESEKVGGRTQVGWTPPTGTDTSGLITTSLSSSVIASLSDGLQDGSGFLADLNQIANNIDERYSPLVGCLITAYERAITVYENDEEYSRSGGVRENAIRAAHYFRIFYNTWTSLLRSIPTLADKFTNSNQEIENSCGVNLGIQFSCIDPGGGADPYLRCFISYEFPLCAVTGVEVDFTSMLEYLDDPANGISLGETSIWTGDASVKNYLQAFSEVSGKYLAIYGANFYGKTTEQGENEYLRTDLSTTGTKFLTSLTFTIDDFSNWGNNANTFINTLCPNVLIAADDDVTWDTLAGDPAYGGFIALRNAIKTGLNRAKVVSNERAYRPNPQWTGNSFAPSGVDLVGIKDFLTTMMVVVEPDVFDLSEDSIERIVILPDAAGEQTVKEFYNIDNLDLTGVTFTPTGTDPFTDATGNFILPTIDANADGLVDIVDLLTVRNTWLAKRQYPLDSTSISSLSQIVPTECCLRLDIDAEILISDDCSSLCVQPPCYGKVWLSDMLLINDKFGRPERYLLEVSYGINCADETITEVDYPVENVSGVQFRVEGLSNIGITSTLNGFGEEEQTSITAIKSVGWDEHILSSDAVINDTYVSFSTNGKYIDKGKGVLCYLVVEPSSIPSSQGYLDGRLKDEFIVTNKFIKYEDDNNIQAVANVSGIRVPYPLANLRFNSYHTDELMIYERFGIRLIDYKFTTNEALVGSAGTGFIETAITTTPAATWTGDFAGGGTDKDLQYVMNLYATKTYNIDFDADASGGIDIVDIQAVAHTVNDEVFGYGTSVVPRLCCEIPTLDSPVLNVIDYNSGDIELPVNQNGKIRNIELSGSDLGCAADVRNQGGVVLYWDIVDGADYYIVYRKGQTDQNAIPIIASGPGNRNSIGEFPTQDRSDEREPFSILPNMWVDYPPLKDDPCCSLQKFCVDDFFDGDVAVSVTNEIEARVGEPIADPCGETAETFTYYVAAISRLQESDSNQEEGEVACCSYEPLSEDITISVESGNTFTGFFDAYHPLAARPIGACTSTSGSCLPVWFFAQDSINGNGRDSTTNRGGSVVTESKLPDTIDASGVNKRKFTYNSPSGFVGKDSFKYVTTILDTRNRYRPSTWCKTVSDVTVYVIAPAPILIGRAGSFANPSEAGKTFLTWNQVEGATSYNLYRNGVLIDNISSIPEKTDRYSYVDTPTLVSPCVTPEQVPYSISSVYVDPDGSSYESEQNSANVVFPCQPSITTPAGLTLTAVGFNIPIGGTKLSQGNVVVSWSNVVGADFYRVYRRASGGQWRLLGRTSDLTFSDSLASCNDCSPASQDYDYYVTAVASNFETLAEDNLTAISIPCYDAFVPQVSNRTATMQERGTLSSFVTARAIQGTISTYTLVTPPASDEGTLTFNPDGTFTFVAALNFTGTTQFEWQAQDSCGNTSNALFTINVEAISTNTNLEYVIGDANEVTSQQNTVQVRIRNRKTSQVPFMLNNKGASSLRKRCFAFSVTRGIDPFSWAPSSDGCTTPTVGDPALDPGDTCVDPTIGTAIIGTSEIGECE